MRRILRILIVVLALSLAVALADVELVLQNGEILRGTDVRRDGDNYVLTTEDGGAITLPLPIVEQVRLIEQDPVIEPHNLDPEQEQPRTGLQTGGPTQLAGGPVQPSNPREQTAAIGDASEFIEITRSDSMEPSYWDIDHDVLADSRSTWMQPPRHDGNEVGKDTQHRYHDRRRNYAR